jgi:hypothetical protein
MARLRPCTVGLDSARPYGSDPHAETTVLGNSRVLDARGNARFRSILGNVNRLPLAELEAEDVPVREASL